VEALVIQVINQSVVSGVGHDTALSCRYAATLAFNRPYCAQALELPPAKKIVAWIFTL
jgi:hypothetical protein